MLRWLLSNAATSHNAAAADAEASGYVVGPSIALAREAFGRWM